MKLNRYRPRDVDQLTPVEDAGIRGGIHEHNTYLVQMRDGSEWFHKVGVGEERDELFAYELAAFLFGEVVPEVRLADLGKGIGSIMRKVDGVQAKRVDGLHGYFHGNPNLLTDLANMVVMDFLTGNTDRHEGNWFLTNDGRVKAIDNGFVGYDPEIDFKRCLRPVRACGVYHDEELWPEFLLRLSETAREAAGHGKRVRELADRVGLQAREAVDLTNLWEAKMEGLIQAVQAELSKVGGVQKARRYLGEGEEAPEGVEVQEGPRGGRYYEERSNLDTIADGKHDQIITALQGHKTERAIAIKDGKVVGTWAGEATRVTHEQDEDLSGATHYHNHPGKHAPSDGDVEFLLRANGPAVMHIVTPQGVYTLKRLKDGDHTGDAWKAMNKVRGGTEIDQYDTALQHQEFAVQEAARMTGAFSYSAQRRTAEGGSVQKGRRYLGEGEEAPSWAEVKEGAHGGRYYEMRGRKEKPAAEADVITEVQRLKGFGKDVLTRAARDLIRLAVLAGFDPKEVVTRVMMSGAKGEKINSATVRRILGEMESEMDEEKPAEEGVEKPDKIKRGTTVTVTASWLAGHGKNGVVRSVKDGKATVDFGEFISGGRSTGPHKSWVIPVKHLQVSEKQKEYKPRLRRGQQVKVDWPDASGVHGKSGQIVSVDEDYSRATVQFPGARRAQWVPIIRLTQVRGSDGE